MDWTSNVEYIQWGARGWGSQSGEPGFDSVLDGTILNRHIYDVVLTPEEISELHGIQHEYR